MMLKAKPVFLFEKGWDKETVARKAWGPAESLPSMDQMNDLVNDLEEEITEDVEILKPTLVHNLDSLENLKKETTLDVDIFILRVMSSRFHHGWIFEDKITNLGITTIWWDPTRYQSFKSINRSIRLVKTMKKLRRTMGIVIGRSNVDSNWNFRQIGEKTGVSLQEVEMHRILEKRKKYEKDQVEKISKKWEEEVNEIMGPTHEQIRESVRTYLAVKEIMEEEEANAITMDCENLPNINFVPCLGFGKLIDKGIPAGCENDIEALVAMCALMYLSGKSPFMGNFRYEFEKNRVRLQHCVMPRTPTDGSYICRDFHSTGKGVTGYGEIETGEPVTILGINRKFDKFHIIRGRVSSMEDTGDKDHPTPVCRYQLHIDVEDARKVAKNEIGRRDHHTAVLGDYSKDLLRLADMMDIETVVD